MVKRFYVVEAKCGHVGRNNYVIKKLTIIAENGKDAALKARMHPRVKHHWKDAIISCIKVTEEEYWKTRVENYYDPYFSVRSIQDQRRYCTELHDEIIHMEEVEHDKEDRRTRINYLLKKRKIQERYSISC